MFNHKISNLANPTNNNDATNKSYVDNKFNNVPTPTINTQAVNKQYVDDRIASSSANLDGVAKLASENTFTQTQKLASNSPIQVKFTNANGQENGFFGTTNANSGNMELNCSRGDLSVRIPNNDLWISVKNQNIIHTEQDNLYIQVKNNKKVFVKSPMDMSNGGKVTNLPNPTVNGDAANKAYVDSAINPVVTKANQNETNITALTERVNNLSAPNLDNYYTKPETNALLNTKATEITTNINNNKVTTDTNQTITGNKEFTGDLNYKFSGDLGSFKIKKDNAVFVEIGKVSRQSGGVFISSDATEVNLRSYNGGNVVIDGRNNLWLPKAPTDNNHGVNKGYVDNKVNPVVTKANQNETNITALTERVNNLSAPNLDNYYTKPETNNLLSQKANTTELSKYARKDQLNTFNSVQTFQRGINVNNSRIMDVATPTSSSDAANKDYVDRNATKMLLVTCKAKNSLTVGPNSYQILSHSTLSISSETDRGSWNVINIMYNGDVRSNYPNDPSFNANPNTPMLITQWHYPFHGGTYIYFYWTNLSSTTTYTGQPWFNIVLAKNTTYRVETRNAKSIEDLKRELGNKLAELEIINVEEIHN